MCLLIKHSLRELGDNFHLFIKTTRDISHDRVINCAAASSDETRMPVLCDTALYWLGCTVYCVWVTRPGPDTTHLEVTHLVTRELHHGYHCPDVRPGAHHNPASRIVTHTWVTRGTGPCHTLVTIVWCVTLRDIRDAYYRDDDEAFMLEEAGSDHGPGSE